VVHEARLFHAYVRHARNGVEIKGGNAFTENYSVLAPEVLTRHDGKPLPGAQRNTEFIRKLLASDAVVIAGEAASHCVKSSIEDLLTDIQAHDPALAARVYVMKDCMSSVAVPDGKGGFVADYTPQAEAALARFQAAGMHVVESTTPLADWGIRGLA
jgi:nicotinamidase-related amidase